jgi:hypothetical protein
MPDYKVSYPDIVIRALEVLYLEYNKAFSSLAEINSEWDTDYQFCVDQNGNTSNYAVQIDMSSLTPNFLEKAPNMPFDEVVEVVRNQIFEIENSLAMYQLLERIFSENGNSFYKKRARASLEEIRERFERPIALLAVTEEKYQSMLELEFGKDTGESITDEEVKEMSGFDKFFGPKSFLDYLRENDGHCDYLLYARTSDPVDKLKKPNVDVAHPLLQDPNIRRIIKANSLTLNIDAPEMDFKRRINDTKEYMPQMGLGLQISSKDELFSPEFLGHLGKSKPYHSFTGKKLSEKFEKYVISQRVDPESVANGLVALRFKPVKGTYGCYGHIVGTLECKKTRNFLSKNIKSRGDYIVQLEKETVTLASKYCCIDRNFFALTNGHPVFLGGLRSLIPNDCPEAKKGRNHGSSFTVLAEIRV